MKPFISKSDRYHASLSRSDRHDAAVTHPASRCRSDPIADDRPLWPACRRCRSINGMNRSLVIDSENALDASDALGNMGIWIGAVINFIAF